MRSFKLQDPGEGIHEAEILEVRVSPGDEVSEGDIVLVIETDKAAVEVPAPCSGSVERIDVSEGDVVEVGSELMRFDDGETSRDDASSEAEASSENEASSEDEASLREGEGASSAETTSADEGEDEDEDEDEDEGEGEDEDNKEKHGRKTEEKSNRKAPQKASQKGKADEPDRKDADTSRNSPVLASPAARRLAREEGLALSDIDGSGPDGRVLVEDIRARTDEAPASEEARPDEAAAEPADGPDEERVPLRSVRRTVARRMQRAWREIPHVTHTVHADITALSEFRESRKGDFPHLTLTVLVLKALSAALREHQRFNARLEDEEIVISHRHHFGVAVDTDRGLLVPVIRNVDHLSMRALASALEEAVNRARGGTLKASEMQGGTFTITNVGASGASHFTPIINPPQAAILGVAQAELRQVAREAGSEPEWQARRLLPLILAFDHRLNDGMDAARFMNTLADALAGPENLLAAL